MKVWLAILVFAAFSVYANADEVTISINLVTADGIGKEIGAIKAKDTKFGLLFEPNLIELTPGVHGFHIHENPSCEPAEKDGKKVAGLGAGGHFDPHKSGKHEGPYAEGHLGDIPPLLVSDDGKAMLPLLAPRLKVSDLKGRSVMIHAGGDNYSDLPQTLGGGGARIACGVVR